MIDFAHCTYLFKRLHQRFGPRFGALVHGLSRNRFSDNPVNRRVVLDGPQGPYFSNITHVESNKRKGTGGVLRIGNYVAAQNVDFVDQAGKATFARLRFNNTKDSLRNSFPSKFSFQPIPFTHQRYAEWSGPSDKPLGKPQKLAATIATKD